MGVADTSHIHVHWRHRGTSCRKPGWIDLRGCIQRRILQNEYLDTFHMGYRQYVGSDPWELPNSGRHVSN